MTIDLIRDPLSTPEDLDEDRARKQIIDVREVIAGRVDDADDLRTILAVLDVTTQRRPVFEPRPERKLTI